MLLFGTACFLLGLLTCAPKLHAAASNDAFASAAVLSPALPINLTASNVGATEEVSEPQPETSASTLWWSWTPGTTGWVKIKTAGSNIDTVLAVYTGNNLAGLTLLAFNDDTGDIDVESGVSEVVLEVTAGTTYRVQIGGYDGWEGSFNVQITSTPSPPLLKGLSLNPATVDVSNQASQTVVDVQVTHPAGVVSGNIALFRPDGIQETQGFINSNNRISGNAFSGTYRVTLTVRQLVLPGLYTMRIELRGLDGRSARYGESTPLPAGLPRSVQVINTGVVDNEAPKIAELTINPISPDVTTTGQMVSIFVRIKDPLSGMVDFSSSLVILHPSGVNLQSTLLSRRNRIAGDSKDGTYAIQYTLPAGSAPGIYKLSLNLVDTLDNAVSYGTRPEFSETPFPAGFPSQFTVVNKGSIDTQPPTIASVTLVSNTVNVAALEPLKLRVVALDSKSGVGDVDMGGAQFGLRPLAGGPVLEFYTDFAQSTGTPQNGLWEGYAILPESTPPGQYLVVGIRLTDLLGNTASYGPADLGLIPYPAGVNPVVTLVSKPPEGPYSLWLKKYPSLTGAAALRNADPDGDGLENLTELALGTDPTIPSKRGGTDPNADHAPFLRRQSRSLYLDYTVVSTNLGTGPKAIQVIAEESTNLKSWDGAQILILGDGAVSAFVSMSGPKKFMRLRVTDPAQ